jgi:transmembrane protein 216
MLTSLPLQVLLFFGGWWDVLAWLVGIAVFVYKGARAPPRGGHAGSAAAPADAAMARAHTEAARAAAATTAAAAPHRTAGLNLPYPAGRFGAEFALQWLWLLVEPPRLFLASKGNKTEAAGPLLLGLALGLPLAAFLVYYLHFQTFV